MKDKKIYETRELLKKAYSILPNDFSLREIRFSIQQTLQKIELFEVKHIRRQENIRQQEELAIKQKLQINNLPYQQYDAKKTIGLIDEMIKEEERKINVKQTKPVIKQDEEDSQTFYG